MTARPAPPRCPTCGQPLPARPSPGPTGELMAANRRRRDGTPGCSTCDDTGVIDGRGGFAFCTECRPAPRPPAPPSTGAVESALGLGQSLAATSLDRGEAAEAIELQLTDPRLRTAALDAFDRSRGLPGSAGCPWCAGSGAELDPDGIGGVCRRCLGSGVQP